MATKKVQKRGASRKAEGGEVWDLVKVGQEQTAAARALLRLLDLPGLPAFVSENLYTILNHAAKVQGVAIGSDAPCGYSVKARADLFAVTTGFQSGLRFEPSRDFAELLSAVLTHPDCPVELYNAVGDLNCMQPASWDTPEHIRLALGHVTKGGA